MRKTIRLIRVQYIPDVLEPGNLYVAEEFGAAVHLCACGCGAKIRTPLGPADWSLEVTRHGPSLFPSIGNWQQRCQSHYWIRHGRVIVAPAWTAEEIARGRSRADARDWAQSEQLQLGQLGLRRFWKWLARKFGR